MQCISDELQKCARTLLTQGDVDLVVGYTKGPLPLTSTPTFIRDEKDADNLVFDLTCHNNVSTYLIKDKERKQKNDEKVGVIAKGCDGRSIVQYIIEGQIKREEVSIIGVPCEGVIDSIKLRKKIGEQEILKYQINDKEVVVEGRDFRLALSKRDILSDSCLVCKYPNTPVYDIFVGEPRKELNGAEEFELVNKLEKMDSTERWLYFEKELSKCIRCYACRNVCPLCYCKECFVDQTDPQWFGKSTGASDRMIFHIVRVLHTAGRCVDCGACARACPVGINLRALNKKVEKEIQKRFRYTAGLDLDAIPPMATYDENDTQEFIM